MDSRRHLFTSYFVASLPNNFTIFGNMFLAPNKYIHKGLQMQL